MKRLLLAACLSMLGLDVAGAQAHPYRVVFDLTSRDTLDQKAVLRWIKEIGTSAPKAELEVVMYGKGFEMVTAGRTQFAAQVAEAMKNPRVSFRVCAIALRNNAVDVSQLLPGVKTVPDGIRELVLKQQEHWGYIKVSH